MRTLRVRPTCPQRLVMKTVHCVIYSVLMVMNFRLQLQAQFEAKSDYFVTAPSSTGSWMLSLPLEFQK